MEINFSHSKSKIQTLTDAIRKEIVQEKLQVGDNLLSINEASNQYHVSRDTVFKAYNELKKVGLIDSNPQKGYFVKGDVNSILLLLDTYSSFKQNLYNRFVENLPENYKVDVIFHQFNERLYETIVRESIGKYSLYVAMSFSNDKFSEILHMIPSQKLLLIDLGNFNKSDYSYICQDFNAAFYNCLVQADSHLKKYNKAVLVFLEVNRHPSEAVIYFEKYCQDYHFEYEIIRHQSEWKGTEPDAVYLCFTNEDLVKIIKDADSKGLQPGKNIGLIRYNNEPVLEVIKNGISSISIDFGLMGEMAAQFVRTKQPVQEYISTELIIRGSL